MDRAPTKRKIAEELWVRPQGATMREVVAATGGPQYNELKRLTARGYGIRKVKEGGETRYFAVPPAAPYFEATITSKGQVTVPREIREQLRLRSGHKLRFALEDANRAVITPVSKRLHELAGMLSKPKRKATLEEMDEGIRNAVAEKYLRATGRAKR